MFACKHCEFKSYNEITLSRHVRKNHGFSCKDCDFASKSKIEYKLHRKTHPYTAPQPKKCKIEGCEFAGLRFEFNQHMQNIHGIKVSGSKTLKKCQRCDHLTDDSGSLRKHEKICLKSENMNECKVENCGQTFGTENLLRGLNLFLF